MNKSSFSIIFSGIQPTGNLHLGNYLGSIANWVNLQDENNCLFGIMDLHSITVPKNPKDLQNNILQTAVAYLASGIDPEKSIIFPQSAVVEHLELAWILGCITPMGWLNRMTQFKEKSGVELPEMVLKDVVKLVGDIGSKGYSEKKLDKISDSNFIETVLLKKLSSSSLDNLEKNSVTNLGLYSYPVLMAADILLYKANLVPVGEDQKQHLELARDLAGAFNRQFKTDFFQLPNPLILGVCARVMSLQDGLKKMSKSDESEISRINLVDNKEIVVKKIKKAKTDSMTGIVYNKNRPEIYNLLNIFAACTKERPEEIALKYQNSGSGKFKEDLAEALFTMLEPIQNNIKDLQNNLSFVKKVLKTGEEKAREIASTNIKKIKEIVGLK